MARQSQTTTISQVPASGASTPPLTPRPVAPLLSPQVRVEPHGASRGRLMMHSLLCVLTGVGTEHTVKLFCILYRTFQDHTSYKKLTGACRCPPSQISTVCAHKGCKDDCEPAICQPVQMHPTLATAAMSQSSDVTCSVES